MKKNMAQHKIGEYADNDEVESLPNTYELELVQRNINKHYEKFLHGDCSPLKTEIPQLKAILTKLKEVESEMLKIYKNH
jgi:hypothetical protein